MKFTEKDITKDADALALLLRLNLQIRDVDFIWSKKMPAADLIQKNKPKKAGGHTSHIAVTSLSKKYFDRVGMFLDTPFWGNVPIKVSDKMIEDSSSQIFFKKSTMAISNDAKKAQYKIGKRSENGLLFNNLRDSIFIEDQFVVVKTKNDVLVMAFKNGEEPLMSNTIYTNTLFSNDDVENAINLNHIKEDKIQDSGNIVAASPFALENITSIFEYDSSENSEPRENKDDPEKKQITIQRDADLSTYHEKMKKVIVSYHKNRGWLSKEEYDNIDIVLFKDDLLKIIEVKSATNGKDSIYKAIGQLLYYKEKISHKINLEGIKIELIICSRIKGIDSYFESVLKKNSIEHISYNEF
ncbi:hypothetical protein MYMA111404_03765 [Mycoplasma marinum]|uniref:Uncharacterized protein n=1 Tax=Mycoplasma marinum TaxID=1937190 RepID=A0A4R0XTK2_9MOLU|nr:hypothetical protein [Mycoplasma marinum]TCG10969.1 hypothetical protein C4B24_03340 [Mycoplasma marinum]